MRQAAIEPSDITLVVITYAHGAHVLGLLSDNQEPIFLNAIYVISREEMAFWQSRIDTGVVDHGPIVAMMQE